MKEIRFFDLFQPTPRQATFLQKAKRHRLMLYGGARGGGKSMILRWALLWRLLDWASRGYKDVRVGLFSEDYPTLKDRQITKIRKEFPAWLGTIKATQEEGLGFYVRPEYGGGAILLRNLDDPSKYQSAEFAGVAVEELTKNPIEMFDVLRGSLRWPGIEDTFFWGATNPGGVGHLWVRALWVDRDYAGDMARFSDLTDDFCFVPSLPSDNPHLTQTYWQDLNSLPEPLYKAWVEGSWDVFEGQAFPEWAKDAHTTKYEPERQVDDSIWSGSCDWGRNVGVLHLFCSQPKRHFLRHEWVFGDKDPYTVGFEWVLATRKYPPQAYIVFDAPPVADNGQSIMERFQNGVADAWRQYRPGFPVPAVTSIPRSKGSRHAKKQLLHEYLKYTREEDGTIKPWNLPLLQIHESCAYIIRTLPALPLAENDTEDVDTDAEDHGYDALAGWLLARTPRIERDPEEVGPPQNRHPGFTTDGVRKRPWAIREEEPGVAGRYSRYDGGEGGEW